MNNETPIQPNDDIIDNQNVHYPQNPAVDTQDCADKQPPLESSSISLSPEEETADSKTISPEETAMPQKTPVLKKIKHFVRDLVVCSLQVLILTLIIINFIGRVSVVQGQSMYPCLSSNNRIIVNLFLYKITKPQRGEIVVFKCPKDQDKDYIKRIIGLPGEEVEIIEGAVYINGEMLEEPYITQRFDDEYMEKIELSSNQVFVLGDNRANSEDSRSWGALETNLIKGKAVLVFWPPESFSLFK